jgi:hypothetical protein
MSVYARQGHYLFKPVLVLIHLLSLSLQCFAFCSHPGMPHSVASFFVTPPAFLAVSLPLLPYQQVARFYITNIHQKSMMS